MVKIKPETFKRIRDDGITMDTLAAALKVAKSTIYRRQENGWRRESIEFFCLAATRLTGQRFIADDVIDYASSD